MAALGLAPLGAFLLVGAAVGLKLLRLARRTRGLPEAVLGAGLAGVCFVTLPTQVLTVAFETGSVGLGCMVAVGLAKLSGVRVVANPLTQLLMGSAGLAVAAGWYLAFLPPAAYLRWVDRRAPRGA